MTVGIDVDKGDVGRKKQLVITRITIATKDQHPVLHGSSAHPSSFDDKFEDRTVTDVFPEFYLIHADGHKLSPRILKAGGNPGVLIHPLQEIAPEEKAVMIQMPRQNELMIFHPHHLTLTINRIVTIFSVWPLHNEGAILPPTVSAGKQILAKTGNHKERISFFQTLP